MPQEHLVHVAQWLKSAERAVAFTGAGISTESGIPDFRSPGGIWTTSRPIYFQEFLSSSQARQEYWQQRSGSHQDFAAAQPNLGHRALAKWEHAGRVRRVITQNIDGLHTLAGNRQVVELHGTARLVGCLSCQVRFDAERMIQEFLRLQAPPDCPQCGGLLKHATISFGQSLAPEVLQEATQLCSETDLLLVLGSSLVVQPAASLPLIARQQGARLVLINRDPTPLDGVADAVIRAPIGVTLAELDQLLVPQ